MRRQATSRKEVMRMIVKVSAGLLLIPASALAVFATYVFIRNRTCQMHVTQDVARDLIEHRLAEPRSTSALRGKLPTIEEIRPLRMTIPNCPKCTAYQFRLSGTSRDSWGEALFDECGEFELSGDFAGKS
jgi:hypothetical protein